MAFKLKSGNKPQFKNMGSSPMKHKQDPHTAHHAMTGTVNDKGTKVVNEKGDWVGSGDRSDLVKKPTKKSPMKTNVPTEAESKKGVTAGSIKKSSYESTTNPDGSKETTSMRTAEGRKNFVEKKPSYKKTEITSKGHHRLPDEKTTSVTEKGKKSTLTAPLKQNEGMKALRGLKKIQKAKMLSTKKEKVSKSKAIKKAWIGAAKDKNNPGNEGVSRKDLRGSKKEARTYHKSEKKAARKEHKEAKKQFKTNYKYAKGLVKSGKAKLKE